MADSSESRRSINLQWLVTDESGSVRDGCHQPATGFDDDCLTSDRLLRDLLDALRVV